MLYVHFDKDVHSPQLVYPTWWSQLYLYQMSQQYIQLISSLTSFTIQHQLSQQEPSQYNIPIILAEDVTEGSGDDEVTYVDFFG